MSTTKEVRPRRLPVPMQTVFQDLYLVTFAVDPGALNALLPPAIRAYDRCGESFISIVVGNLRGMRIAGVPMFLGTNYYQIVYRAIVRSPYSDDPEERGVFFLRSDSNDRLMSFFGNQLTAFRFHYFKTGAVHLLRQKADSLVAVRSQDRRGDLVCHLKHRGPASNHPPAPGFSSVTEERDIVVQLFHAYAQSETSGSLYDLEIERDHWNLERLDCVDHFSAFFSEGPFTGATARYHSAVYIRECRYLWKPMRISSLPGRS